MLRDTLHNIFHGVCKYIFHGVFNSVSNDVLGWMTNSDWIASAASPTSTVIIDLLGHAYVGSGGQLRCGFPAVANFGPFLFETVSQHVTRLLHEIRRAIEIRDWKLDWKLGRHQGLVGEWECLLNVDDVSYRTKEREIQICDTMITLLTL